MQTSETSPQHSVNHVPPPVNATGGRGGHQLAGAGIGAADAVAAAHSGLEPVAGGPSRRHGRADVDSPRRRAPILPSPPRVTPRPSLPGKTLLRAAQGLRRVLTRRCEVFTNEGAEDFMQRGAATAPAYSTRLRLMTEKLGTFLVDRGEAANAFVVEVNGAQAAHSRDRWLTSAEHSAVISCVKRASQAVRRDIEKLESMVEQLSCLPVPIAVPREQPYPPPILPIYLLDPFCRARHHIIVRDHAELDQLRSSVDRLIGLADNYQTLYSAPLQRLATSLVDSIGG